MTNTVNTKVREFDLEFEAAFKGCFGFSFTRRTYPNPEQSLEPYVESIVNDAYYLWCAAKGVK
jgi:hypothetical protein